MMRASLLAAGLAACVIATSGQAADVWVLEGGATTPLPQTPNCCLVLEWVPGAVAHNRGSEAATVRPLHVSNGGTISIPQIVSAGSSKVLIGGAADSNAWITRFDVPEGVDIEGRMDIYTDNIAHPLPVTAFTKIRMPVLHHLVAPGQEQIHYGTDLGGAETRQNIGIYNAGAVPASATIVVQHPFCGSSLMKTATIPADTFVQIQITPITLCTSAGYGVASTSTNTVVTVDQPSLSLVSTLKNGVVLPDVTASVSGSD